MYHAIFSFCLPSKEAESEHKKKENHYIKNGTKSKTAKD